MAMRWRNPGVFVAGLLLGGLAVWALLGHAPERDAAPGPVRASVPAAAAVRAEATADCGSTLLLAKGRGGDDGTESLAPAPPQPTKSQVSALLVRGKEAAAGGRPRDAEALFINACRNARAIAGANDEPVADAMYNLGRLYARQEGGSRAVRTRARELYAAALQGFRTSLGADAEKTRYASEGLAALGEDTQAVAEAKPRPAVRREAPKPSPAKPVEPQAEPPRAVAPQAAQREAAPVPAAPAVARTDAKPSFDCARARSPSEKIICADPDLARQDRELGRLFARAKAAAPDPAAFQRESDARWHEREAECRDRECLQRWYAQRRGELASAPASGEAYTAQAR